MTTTIQPLKALWYIHVSVCSIPLVEAFKTVKTQYFKRKVQLLRINDGYDLG